MTNRTLSTSDRKIFNGLGQAERRVKWGDFIGTLRDDVSAAVLSGIAGYAEIDLTTQPTHEDRITIGRDTYQFIDTGTTTKVTSDAYIAVDVGVDAAAARANLIDAINGDAATAHATITMDDDVTPALGVGVEKVKATESGAKVVIVRSITQGGTTTPGGAEVSAITLSDNLTASVAWNVVDLGKLGLDKYEGRFVATKIDITTAMIASGRAQFECEFDVRGVMACALTSGGKLRSILDDAITFSGKVVTVTLAGTTAPTKSEVVEQSIIAVASGVAAGQVNKGKALSVTAVKAVIDQAVAGGTLTVTVNKIAANGDRTALATAESIAGATPRVPLAIPNLTVPFALTAAEALEFLVNGGAGLSAPLSVTMQATFTETPHSLDNGDDLVLIAFG